MLSIPNPLKLTDLQKDVIADLCCMHGFEPKELIEALKWAKENPVTIKGCSKKRGRSIKKQIERLLNE